MILSVDSAAELTRDNVTERDVYSNLGSDTVCTDFVFPWVYPVQANVWTFPPLGNNQFLNNFFQLFLRRLSYYYRHYIILDKS
jgi:hypothetical protein